MSYWALRIGIALVIVGLVLLSPVADLLPIDFWPRLKGLFLRDPSSSQHQIYRFVPGEENRTFEFALIAIGLLLAALALYLGPKK